jgi:hypothetical protein
MKLIALPTALLIALLAMPAAPAAQEQPAMTAGDLQQLCLGTDHVSKNACRIYILGVTQGLAVGLSIADAKGARSCVPADTSAEALETTLKTRLDADLTASPAHRDRDAARFIATVLARAFPCGKASH